MREREHRAVGMLKKHLSQQVPGSENNIAPLHFQHKTAPELSIPQPERRLKTQEFSVKPVQMHRYHLHKLSKQTRAQQKHASNCNQVTNSAQYKIFIIATGGGTVCCADAHKPVY